MGVSIAHRLASEGAVALLEGAQKDIASRDFSKVIRTQYPDPEMQQIAQKAKDIWESDPLYSRCYTRQGWIRIDVCDYSPKTGLSDGREVRLDLKDFKHIYESSAAANKALCLEHHESLWLNKDVGMVDVAESTNTVSQDAARVRSPWQAKIRRPLFFA